MKKLSFIQKSTESHWVGDGFPVRTLFSYNDIAQEMSPFLLMDYAGPTSFPPSQSTQHRRGVGEHPHRGFETVTLVYEGEVEHRDSSGGGGLIGPGDVQWMTAASGIIHDEFHGTEFAKKGGPFEMIQLWVNLPKKDKMAAPGYQSITNTQIPNVELPENAGRARVIAGNFRAGNFSASNFGAENMNISRFPSEIICDGTFNIKNPNTITGPANTFTPMNVWDLRLNPGRPIKFQVNKGHTTALFVLKGKIQLGTGELIQEAELALFERDQDQFEIQALENTTLLFLNGKPIHEPIVGYGPFVMNTHAEIRQAFLDYQNGKMGKIT